MAIKLIWTAASPFEAATCGARVIGKIDEDEARTHYHFRISLRVAHPHAAPEEITKALGVAPKRSWEAGKPRQTPAGAPLAGINKGTYWTTDITAGRWPTDINDTVHEALNGLVPHRSFLHRVRAEGGSIELFIGWFFESQSGDVLTYQCLALAGDLQIDLSFDVYPPDQPQREYDVSSNKPPRM